MTNDLLSLTQVAELLKKTRQRIYQLYKEGSFPNAQLVGNALVFPKEDVEAWQRRFDKESA